MKERKRAFDGNDGKRTHHYKRGATMDGSMEQLVREGIRFNVLLYSFPWLLLMAWVNFEKKKEYYLYLT